MYTAFLLFAQHIHSSGTPVRSKQIPQQHCLQNSCTARATTRSSISLATLSHKSLHSSIQKNAIKPSRFSFYKLWHRNSIYVTMRNHCFATTDMQCVTSMLPTIQITPATRITVNPCFAMVFIYCTSSSTVRMRIALLNHCILRTIFICRSRSAIWATDQVSRVYFVRFSQCCRCIECTKQSLFIKIPRNLCKSVRLAYP